MTKEQIFEAWSPDNALWSTWVKPVLFAHLDASPIVAESMEIRPDVSWSPMPNERVALVLDLPGDEAVWVGLALAATGYRPVPLYNALPLPLPLLPLGPPPQYPLAAVDVLPIIMALRQSAEELARINIAPDAPPAFLLDANRHGGGSQILPGQFDNRSVCFMTDFPSANFLLSRGIERALLVQRESLEPLDDLAHVLRRWQDGGLKLERIQIGSSAKREPFEVRGPSWYGAMYQRVLLALGLRRARGGGFGAWMPQSSAGG
jgi:hypothetical protein